jgi:hypothetical protein
MNKLERITSIIILSTLPYISNAQTSKELITASIPKEFPKEELLARNTIYRSRTNYNYENEEEITTNKNLNNSIVSEEAPINVEKSTFKINYFDASKFKLNNLLELSEYNYTSREKALISLNENIKNSYFQVNKNIKHSSNLETSFNQEHLSQNLLSKKNCYYTYKKSKSLGHDYEYHLGKHTGLCFEEEVKFDDGKFHLENFSIKIVYYIGR